MTFAGVIAGHVSHCAHDAIASADPAGAAAKNRELLDAVERFVKVR